MPTAMVKNYLLYRPIYLNVYLISHVSDLQWYCRRVWIAGCCWPRRRNGHGSSGGCILGGAVGLVTTPTKSKMARSLMRGIQLKLVFVVVTYTVMCYIQLVAGQGSSLSYLDPSITLDTALFTMDFETSSVDLLEPSSTSSAPTTWVLELANDYMDYVISLCPCLL